jgi:16S rRNA G527 N7-methylase RsmG
MAGTDPPKEFLRICIRNGLTLSDSQLVLLARFVDGLLEWNSKINLVSRRDQEKIWFSHVLHSLAKTAALQDLVDRLGLTGVSVWTGRAEQVHRNQHAAGTFDLVVARAVASLRDLVHWSRPYLRVTRAAPVETTDRNRVRLTSAGLVALKGGDLEKEIAETRIKESVRFVRVVRMSFEGSLELGLEDKKAIIVGI